jgi:cholesterol transport system auxiliary component
MSLFIAGCGASLMQQSAEPPTRTYLLEWPGDSVSPTANPNGPNLLVSPVFAAPGYDTADIAYIRHPYEIEYFAYHRWVDTPAHMLGPLLVRAAGQGGLFRSVTEAGSAAHADLRLDSRLLYLQQVWLAQASELQLALSVSLVDAATARVVGSRIISVNEPVAERTPYAGVEAANRAVARLLSELQGFLAAQVAAAQR